MEPRIRYAKTSDGVSIAYAVLGTGPAIVFPSSLWGNINMYKSAVFPLHRSYDELVSLGWSVITYDGRGSGASDRDVEDHTLDAKLRDLEAVIGPAAPERFALCGSFQGGPTSIAYAVRHPHKVTHLVLSNTFANAAEYNELEPSMRLRDALRDAEGEWEFATLTFANAIDWYTDSELARRRAEAFRKGMTATSYMAFRDAADKIDVRDLLPQIGVPTLVVHATTARQQGIGVVTQRLAPLIPNARFVETGDLAATIDEFLREGGLKPAPGVAAKPRPEPSTFRTVLFTDLVGHTEMMSRLGDERGREVLREHERITREVLKAHGGTEVKTMGDGFMASFGSVTKAVECAVALQRAMAGALTPDPSPAAAGEGQSVFPLKVRCGLNAGEPIEEDGDLFGATVILASRIAARAEGGEILVADTVRGLCSGKGFLFADRGEFEAKGFEEPVRVYEVRWRDE